MEERVRSVTGIWADARMIIESLETSAASLLWSAYSTDSLDNIGIYLQSTPHFHDTETEVGWETLRDSLMKHHGDEQTVWNEIRVRATAVQQDGIWSAWSTLSNQHMESNDRCADDWYVRPNDTEAPGHTPRRLNRRMGHARENTATERTPRTVSEQRKKEELASGSPSTPRSERTRELKRGQMVVSPRRDKRTRENAARKEEARRAAVEDRTKLNQQDPFPEALAVYISTGGGSKDSGITTVTGVSTKTLTEVLPGWNAEAIEVGSMLLGNVVATPDGSFVVLIGLSPHRYALLAAEQMRMAVENGEGTTLGYMIIGDQVLLEPDAVVMGTEAGDVWKILRRIVPSDKMAVGRVTILDDAAKLKVTGSSGVQRVESYLASLPSVED